MASWKGSEADARKQGRHWLDTGYNGEKNYGWENDDDMDRRILKEKADASQGQKEAAADAVKNFDPGAFNYSASNPYINAQKRILDASMTTTKEAQAASLAARGVSNSGQTDRAIARAGQEEGTQIANMAGNDYLRQFQDFQNSSKDKFSKLLENYSISTEEQNSYLQQFYNKMALDQQQANLEYQRSQQSAFDFGGAAMGAISGVQAGSALGPWGMVGGGVLGLLGGGLKK